MNLTIAFITGFTTRGRALAGFISSNSGNHYRWAYNELAKGLMKLR